MRLGLSLGMLTDRDVGARVALARAAEELGYAVVWAAEAYGSDAPTVLAYLAAHTERIDIGSAAMQIPARSPAMTAMTAATLDLLSGGRFRLGLGVSGPQVSEGWHGVRFGHPLLRTREYVDVVRMALRREPVRHEGAAYQLPLPDGPGKALRLSVHPARAAIPLYLAAIGPRNLRLAGEIADGWLAILLAPEHASDMLDQVRAGRSAAGREGEPFDVSASVPVSFGDDVAACADPIRGFAALYVGGMGSREQNFYNRLAREMGYEAAADEVQRLFLGGEHRAAMAAVPVDLIDETSLLGTEARVSERLQAYAASGVTTLSVSLFERDTASGIETLRRLAAALDASGVGD